MMTTHLNEEKDTSVSLSGRRQKCKGPEAREFLTSSKKSKSSSWFCRRGVMGGEFRWGTLGERVSLIVTDL